MSKGLKVESLSQVGELFPNTLGKGRQSSEEINNAANVGVGGGRDDYIYNSRISSVAEAEHNAG